MNISAFEKKRLEKINNYLLTFQLTFHFIVIIWVLQFQKVDYSTMKSFYSLLVISFLGVLTLFFLGKLKVNHTKSDKVIQLLVFAIYIITVVILVYLTQSFVARLLFFIPLILVIIRYGKKLGLIITFFTLLTFFLIELVLYEQTHLDEILIFSSICFLILWLISNLMETEQEIRNNLIEMANRDKCILENNDNGIVYIDKNSEVKILNNKAEKLLNVKKEDYLDKKDVFKYEEINSNDFLRTVFSCDEANCCYNDKSIFFYNNRDLFLNCSKITDNEGNYLGKIVIIKDLTQDNLLHHIQQSVQFISSSINMPIITVDTNGYITFFNNEAKQLFKKDYNVLSCGYDKIISDENLSNFIKEVLSKPKHIFNKELNVNISGALKEVLISVGIIRDQQNDVKALTFIVNDVTEIREKERFLAQADKLSTVGKLAAGVAHEIRNPLTTIKGMAQVLIRNVELETAKSSLNLIIDEANRANSIIKDFLDFAKPSQPEYVLMDFNKMINEFSNLIESHCSLNNVSYKLVLPNDQESIYVYWDEKKIKQVFLNLCLNALDAMKDCATKELNIEIEHKNDKVIINFKDTGVGLEEDVINNIWEPFFTTKNEGTGLGLSICNNIIKEHGGSIDLTSEVNIGSSFRIILPVDPQNS